MKQLPGILLLFAVTALLSGFNIGLKDADFPAPIAEPALAVYHNLTIAEANPLQRSGFMPEELFFYFLCPDNYCVILTGKFDPDKILHSSRLSDEQRIGTVQEESVFLKRLELASERFGTTVLGFGNNLVMVAPAKVFGCYDKRIVEKKNVLGKKFDAFKKMYAGRPGLAGEIDFKAFKAVVASTSLNLPDELKWLQHFRIIIDNRLIRAQLFSVEDDARNKLNQAVRDLLPDLFEYSDKSASFTLSIQGSSIYVESEADFIIEKKITCVFSNLISRYFNADIDRNRITTFSRQGHEDGKN